MGAAGLLGLTLFIMDATSKHPESDWIGQAMVGLFGGIIVIVLFIAWLILLAVGAARAARSRREPADDVG